MDSTVLKPGPFDWDYCDPCNGPVLGRGDLILDLSWIAHWLWLHLPDWLIWNRVGFAILPWAGNIAFACSCRDKNREHRLRNADACLRALAHNREGE